jgi:hypothetical protein
MNYLKMMTVLLFLSVSFSSVFASEDHHDEEQEHEENNGIQLSAEAIKNFDLKSLVLTSSGPWDIPNSAVLNSLEEVNVYRLRNGFYKRIDFKLISKAGTSIKIRSDDLIKGDAIVIQGVGFLRTAEITASGGAPEGHSH